MYRFIDARLCDQSPAVRILVLAMRHWVIGAVNGRCVCHVVGCAFRSLKLDPALDDFHLAMRTLYNNALVSLTFGSFDRSTITEHEAILLGALAAASEAENGSLQAVSRGLVHADMAPVLAQALVSLAGQLEFADQALTKARRAAGRSGSSNDVT
jgi:hypothetical protein